MFTRKSVVQLDTPKSGITVGKHCYGKLLSLSLSFIVIFHSLFIKKEKKSNLVDTNCLQGQHLYHRKVRLNVLQQPSTRG